MSGHNPTMGKAAIAIVALLAMACVSAPATAPERVATPVNASAGKTWDAVIDIFAERNIPIRTMERASGFIAAEPAAVDKDDGVKWADCGGALGVRIGAEQAIYNVLVRGDSAHATVRTTVLWKNGTQTCTTRGVWEQAFEGQVKTRAEATTAAR